MTAIEWTDETWNPLIGCSRVSEGCRHCYAERQAYRCAAMGWDRYDGLTKKVGSEIRWTGDVRLVEHALDKPLRWQKPRRIFVNSMSDLFHEHSELDWIARIFNVMAGTPQHTFQVLTKRAQIMQTVLGGLLEAHTADWRGDSHLALAMETGDWPLPNVWLGVSVEDQATADERIPLLLKTPAAVRWVSYEPALGPVDFAAIRYKDELAECRWNALTGDHIVENSDSPSAYMGPDDGVPHLDWIVVGGESGPGARPFDIAWARQTIAQGRATRVPVFLKQIGALPYSTKPLAEPEPRVSIVPPSRPKRKKTAGTGPPLAPGEEPMQ